VDVLGDGLLEALRLLLTGDEDVWAITGLTLRVSLGATVVALLLGVPVGMTLALGRFRLLYTPTAMVIAQAAIATPVVAALTTAALQQVDPDFLLQMRGLGATRLRALGALLMEAKLPLLTAGMAGFGAVVSEVGAAQMVGGNLAGETRVLTTAAVLATSRGQFALAIAFGLILLLIAFTVNLVITMAQHRQRAAR
jgi:tungstate transport system permease protein